MDFGFQVLVVQTERSGFQIGLLCFWIYLHFCCRCFVLLEGKRQRLKKEWRERQARCLGSYAVALVGDGRHDRLVSERVFALDIKGVTGTYVADCPRLSLRWFGFHWQ